MNNKITFPKLASLLADKSGRSKRFSEDFLRDFFALISDQLEAGETVKIKGLGTFRLMRVEPRKSVDVTTGQPMEISGHSKVVFTPAKELAEAVNAPFEAFSTIEIGDDVDINEIDESPEDIPEEPQLSEKLNEYPEAASENIPEPAAETIAPQTDLLPLESNEKKEEYDDFEMVDEPSEPDTSGNEEWRYYERARERRQRVRRQWMWAGVFGLGCAALGVIVTFAVWSLWTRPDFSKPEKTVKVAKSDVNRNSGEQEINKAENSDEDEFEISEEELANLQPLEIDPVPTSASDEEVYDTIGTSRYLTTMAKAHYGNNKLWPYIYEENKDNIGHPDRIRPGTPIRIPKLSKYGVDPNNKSDIEKANKLAVEIYARYGKKI